MDRWKKFNNAMGLIYELGKILGGLVKYYGKKVKDKVWGDPKLWKLNESTFAL